MAAFEYFSPDLLQPVSSEQPGGVDLRYDPVFAAIAEARRADDDLSEGEWQKQGGRKVAEWGRVSELCLEALRSRSKDLRIAGYLTEAAVRQDGFSGLRDCLKLEVELIRRFWDQGLFPSIEENGDLEYRASALIWLNDRLPQIVAHTPLTARTGGENYGFSRYQQAQRVGSESAMANVSGEKRETLRQLINQGWITMDQFEGALKGTSLSALEAIFKPFDEAELALHDLEKLSDERFGASAPSFSSAKETMSEIRRIIAPAIRTKQQTGPGRPPEAVPAAPQLQNLPSDATPAATGGDREWDEAEALIRAGRVDLGLTQMATVAAAEPSGRGRFMRKLKLSDVCLANKRDRLARTVLEELNQQIEEFHLARWESSALVGAVWSRLYRIYRKTDDSDDQGRAKKLYSDLARLDPWQAYINCED